MTASDKAASTPTDLVGRRCAAGLAALFTGSGVLHLVRPAVFESIVPPSLSWLADPRTLVYLSGVAELACAGGLLMPRTRRWAGWGSAALLVAVFPANVQMALDARAAAAPGTAYRVGTYLRLPLQVPLIWIALRAGKAGGRGIRRRIP